ncbi:MAG: tetratricopeptide repeat protein [Balneolaceae bacterium]|nr:tetratricopeptide repeat protein [Balneolaceae bacterium]
MKKHFYSLFSVFALTFLLISCGSENELITPIKQGINSQNYDAALVAADSAIAAEPTNGQANYYKAYALSRIAANEPVVTDRKPILVDMRENLMIAREKFDAMEEPPFEAEQITELTIESWSREHNAAIGYATDDSVMASVDQPLKMAIAHLQNAVTINPDSALSHDVLAQIYHMDGNYAGASSSLVRAIEIRGEADAADYDRLASYYFMLDDYDKALESVNTGLEIYPDSVFLVQKKADALFQTGQTDAALEVVAELIAREPNNPQYHLVVGTQIYQRVQELSDEYQQNNDKIYDLKAGSGNDAEIEALQARNQEILEMQDDLTNRAEASLLNAIELDDSNPVSFNTLGILYQNKAAALFEQRNMTTDNDEAARLDELARAEAEKAMLNYERAAELNPDDQGIWETLFRIYTLLDYREKAEAAMEKAGM